MGGNEGCYHEIVRETLDDPKVIGLLNSVSKGICNKVPDTVISSAMREEIWLPITTSARAAGLIKDVSNCTYTTSVPNL